MDIHEQINDVIFPEAVSSGGFGNDVIKVHFRANEGKGTAQYASDAVFGEITVQKKTGESLCQPVLIKTRMKRSEFPGPELSSALFHNEVLFYTKIMPLFRKYDKDNILSTSIPKYVYGKATNGQNPDEDIIVLKDLREKGFKPCVNPENLDEDHLELILDRLGKFHALSFLSKKNDPVGFEEIILQIKPFRVASAFAGFAGVINKEAYEACLFRGIEPLREEPKYRDKLADLCANYERSYDNESIDKYKADRGPFPVIIHGDFRLDNMLFKYRADGKPIEVVLFDFQTIMFSSPAIDTSTLLFMETPGGVRRACWDRLLQVYYDALSNQMDDHQEKPSIDAVELDLRKRGVYALYLLSIGFPVLICRKADADIPPPPKLENLDQNQYRATMEVYKQTLRERGGPGVTETLVEAVRFMIDKDFIFDD